MTKKVWKPEDDICTYCGKNKWINPNIHITEIATFLQKQIEDIQTILKNI